MKPDINCKDVDIKLCHECRTNIYGHSQLCHINQWQRSLSMDFVAQGFRRTMMEYLIIHKHAGNTWLYAAVRYYYPEHVEALEKLLLLM